MMEEWKTVFEIRNVEEVEINRVKDGFVILHPEGVVLKSKSVNMENLNNIVQLKRQWGSKMIAAEEIENATIIEAMDQLGKTRTIVL